MNDLEQQTNVFRTLKRLGCSVKFTRPNDNEVHDVSLVVFIEAGRVGSHGQIAYIAGLLMDEMSEGFMLHTIS